jgi:putative colanic acid biosynthesis UDP-glucose lipid carrier transferase|tara:strand:- start:392 stop:1849 length:1458 start_codon:yes stop_codon:yes gene_type:complete
VDNKPSEQHSLIDADDQKYQRKQGLMVKHQSSFSTLYRLVDLFLTVVIYFYAIYYFEAEHNTGNLVLLLTFVVGYQLSAEALQLYRSWRGEHTVSMLKATAVAWTASCAITISLSYFLYAPTVLPTPVILMWFGATFLALTSWRYVMRKLLFKLRKSGYNSRFAIVVGANKVGYNLALQMLENEQLGIRFKGIYDDRAEERLPHEFKNQIAGKIEEAIELAKNNQVDYIYIALPMSAKNRIQNILERCSDSTASVFLIPDFFMYNLLNARWHSVGSVQALSVYDTPFDGLNNVLKRAEDIVLSILILIMLAIPMLCIALAVKLTSPGPVIFKQKRYGLDGRQILVYKFRSMSTQDNGNVVKQATKNDPRITPLGSFLRRTSLDELPQFINVIQGRMSIVGPRPHAVAHNEEFRKIIKGYMLRHKVKPGITGWAQINGLRGETETITKMVKRVEFDLEYIHRWSLWFDLKIIFRTALGGFSGKNVY